MNWFERVIIKFTSARFWLAIFTGIAFLACSVNGIIPVKDMCYIIIMVFGWYFSQKREEIK